MKNRKLNITAIFTNLLLALFVALFIYPATEINPIVTTAILFVGGTGVQLFLPNIFTGIAMAGVYKEIWTGELVQSFQPEINASFLMEIPDQSRYVQSSAGGENQVIHMIDIGADPEVLINNTTYPIGYSTLANGDISFQLDKYDTVATKVTDDELYAISYDKIAVVNTKHKNSILAKKFGKAIHQLGPQGNTSDTPVIGTTGVALAGKKSCCVDDIISLAGALSDAGVPDDGQRILVLHSKHVTGILKEVKNFYKDFANIEKGQLKSLFYGFKVYVYHNNPRYLAVAKTKVSYGAIANPATQNDASIAFYAPDMFRAEGSTTMYYDKADTQNHASAVNYRHYFLVSPKKARAIAALVTSNE